jgi:hypothetical protein
MLKLPIRGASRTARRMMYREWTLSKISTSSLTIVVANPGSLTAQAGMTG